MDGDVAPLAEIVELAAPVRRARGRRRGARDRRARARAAAGACAAAGVASEVDVIVGTLGKALGSYGAYAACDSESRELLLNTARPFIFSTAPPPPSVAAALAALDVLEAQPELAGAAAADRRAAARGAGRARPATPRLERPRSCRS